VCLLDLTAAFDTDNFKRLLKNVFVSSVYIPVQLVH